MERVSRHLKSAEVASACVCVHVRRKTKVHETEIYNTKILRQISPNGCKILRRSRHIQVQFGPEKNQPHPLIYSILCIFTYNQFTGLQVIGEKTVQFKP